MEVALIIGLVGLAGLLIALLDRQDRRHKEELDAERKERQNLLTRIQDPIAGVSQGFELVAPQAPDKPYMSEDDEIKEFEAQLGDYTEG